MITGKWQFFMKFSGGTGRYSRGHYDFIQIGTNFWASVSQCQKSKWHRYFLVEWIQSLFWYFSVFIMDPQCIDSHDYPNFRSSREAFIQLTSIQVYSMKVETLVLHHSLMHTCLRRPYSSRFFSSRHTLLLRIWHHIFNSLFQTGFPPSSH